MAIEHFFFFISMRRRYVHLIRSWNVHQWNYMPSNITRSIFIGLMMMRFLMAHIISFLYARVVFEIYFVRSIKWRVSFLVSIENWHCNERVSTAASIFEAVFSINNPVNYCKTLENSLADSLYAPDNILFNVFVLLIGGNEWCLFYWI